MKIRLLAVMAVVVVGVMAGTSPAMAAKAKTASAWSKQHKDNKVFGEAIHNLRKSSDSTNFALSTIAGEAVKALSALQTGLVGLAGSYTNFEYGVVQLYAGSDAIPGAFLATPRIDPTVEQSTVSGQFACLPTALGNVCDSADVLHAKVAIRSVNPVANDAKSAVYCRINASQTATAGTTLWSTSKPNTAFPGATSPNFPPAFAVTRSPITPTDAAELKVFPLQPVSTDTLVDLLDTTNSYKSTAAAGPSLGTGGFSLLNSAPAGLGGAGASPINVTLSCLSVPSS
jgi:hypothetical protein